MVSWRGSGATRWGRGGALSLEAPLPKQGRGAAGRGQGGRRGSQARGAGPAGPLGGSHLEALACGLQGGPCWRSEHSLQGAGASWQPTQWLGPVYGAGPAEGSLGQGSRGPRIPAGDREGQPAVASRVRRSLRRAAAGGGRAGKGGQEEEEGDYLGLRSGGMGRKVAREGPTRLLAASALGAGERSPRTWSRWTTAGARLRDCTRITAASIITAHASQRAPTLL